MAFGNITTLYLPTQGNAGASQWGSDVRKLLDSADTGNDTNTRTSHGTGGATTRTLDPYTLNSSDLTQADYGWAVTPTDMNSASGARRFYPAGNHVLTIRTASDVAHATSDAQYTMYVYRVGPSPGRTRTLLGSASGSSFSYGVVANTYRTATVTVALGEVIFEADETIQYSVEQSCPGVVITGRTNTHDTGTQGGVAIRIDTPKLGVLADGDGASTGAGAASGVGAPRFSGVGSIAGVGAASGVGAATGAGVGAATGDGAASGVGAPIFSGVGAATGDGAAAGIGTGIFSGVGSSDGIADAAAVGLSIFSGVGSIAGVGAASGVGAPIFSGVGSIAGLGAADGQGSSVAATVASADGTGAADGQASIVLGTVGTVDIGGGGGTTVFVID